MEIWMLPSEPKALFNKLDVSILGGLNLVEFSIFWFHFFNEKFPV
jgi:hypothetical protein